METSVLMERKLFNGLVKQDSKTGFVCLNDIEYVGNQQRFANKKPFFSMHSWINSQPTKEFISEVEKQFGTCIKTKKGKNGSTWANIYIALDMALAIEPQFKVEVYKWIFDELIEYRNNSGDSYKKMCGSLYENCNNKSNFHRSISKTAHLIQNACNVNDWQKATSDQLKLRDKIHDNISLLCDVLRDNNQAIRIGIMKAINS